MTKMARDFTVVGIAKGWIGVHPLSTRWHKPITTPKPSLARFAAAAKDALAVFGASGGHDRPLPEQG